MPSITVKNIPDELYERLKRSAEVNRRSINQEIIYCIEQTISRRKETTERVLIEARRLREKTSQYRIPDEELTQAKNEGRP